MTKYCGNCNRPVYHAEQMNAAGGVYHRECFVCVNPNCGRRLDSRSYNEHENKLFCKFCYKDQFGPSGIGFGMLCISKQQQKPEPVNGVNSTHQNNFNHVRFYGNLQDGMSI
ncbi:LIM zinc-binding domain-containing protein [Aphelenchoides besseyi]|nr:LIM zinc-binding domain-containing protein [Aphelenchoides besseyi]